MVSYDVRALRTGVCPASVSAVQVVSEQKQQEGVSARTKRLCIAAQNWKNAWLS